MRSKMCWHDAPAQIILIENRRSNPNQVTADELLDKPDNLGQQDLPVSFPRRPYLIVHVPGGLEDDTLHAKALPKLFKIDGADAPYVWLTFHDGRQIGDGGRRACIELQDGDRCQV